MSSPDGALLSSRLAHVAAGEAIHNAGATQHRPIKVTINTRVLANDHFAWTKGVGGWQPSQLQAFNFKAGQVSVDQGKGIDDLWSECLQLSHGPVPASRSPISTEPGSLETPRPRSHGSLPKSAGCVAKAPQPATSEPINSSLKPLQP